MTGLPVSSRIMFLCDDAQRIRRQLEGGDLASNECGALRNDVSTDEITPNTSLTFHDERLGNYVYTGFKAGSETPIAVGGVRRAGFGVVVAGARYGKGSSREHSPAAELHAGIRLVIAASFERIYRQNADNVGLFTSTDFGLVDRIRRGEAIAVEDLVAGRDRLAAAVLRAGGLLRYGAGHMRELAPCDAPPARPMTLVEKILSRNLAKTADTDCTLIAGEGAFVRPQWRFIVDVYTGMASHTCTHRSGRPSGLRTCVDHRLRRSLFVHAQESRPRHGQSHSRDPRPARGARRVRAQARRALARLSERCRRL